jgi:hypothetical protein
MWNVIVVIILCLCLSALLRLESKTFVAACRDASVIRGISEFVHCRTLASRHAATISLDSSLKRADSHKHKMMTTITFHICNLFHLWSQDTVPLGIWNGGSDLDLKQETVKISGSRSGNKSGSQRIRIPNNAEPHNFYTGSAPYIGSCGSGSDPTVKQAKMLKANL